MQTEFAKKLGVDIPLFAFTHCRDVVVEVSKAGGIGVLGAAGFSPEQLKQEMDWIDERIGNHIYGVDIVIPRKYEGKGEMDAEKLEAMLESMVPQGHRDFAEKLLTDHGVPPMPEGSEKFSLHFSEAQGSLQVDEILKHPKCRMVVNALGTPPIPVVKRIHDSGRLVGALAGRLKHGISHKNAGLDFVVALGCEGGGHTGTVASTVLWPQMVDALAPLPVIAAGGIASGRQMLAAMSMGVAGVWLGSIWLLAEESYNEPAQKAAFIAATSEDTVQSTSWTGKTARMLRNDWTEAWARSDTPDPLPMPLQSIVTADAAVRTHKYANSGECQKVSFNAVGQVVGQMHREESCRDIVYRLLKEYDDAFEHLKTIMPG